MKINVKKVYLSFKGQTIIFLLGGLPFLGLADNFFKSNPFQTIFSLHFVMKTMALIQVIV